MNFPFILQTRQAASNAPSAGNSCLSIHYPNSDHNRTLYTPIQQDLNRCSSFSRMTVSNIASFQNVFRSTFRFSNRSPLANIHVPWQLNRTVLTRFQRDLNSFKNNQPNATETDILSYIQNYALDNNGLAIQLDSVPSTESYPERTASQILAMQTPRTKCTGIAYVYAALLQAAGLRAQFAWRPYNNSGQVIEHLYLTSQLADGRHYIFDPLVNGRAQVIQNTNAITFLTARETLAWHYYGLVANVRTEILRTASPPPHLITRQHQLLQIAYVLDPLNPYIRRSREILGSP